MSDTDDSTEQVMVDRETLETLRAFTDAHLTEYGWPAHIHAIIDSGIALGLDDPTPSTEFRRMDSDGMREIMGDEVVDHLRERWEHYSETEVKHD